MYVPINPLGYCCIKELQRDNLLHAYNEPINIYSVVIVYSTGGDTVVPAAMLPPITQFSQLHYFN